MNAGEITILVLLAVNLLLNAHLHGKKKDGSHNFWISLVANILNILLLYWAGLFR